MTRTLPDVESAGPASFGELRVRDCSIKRTLDVLRETPWRSATATAASRCTWSYRAHTTIAFRHVLFHDILGTRHQT